MLCDKCQRIFSGKRPDYYPLISTTDDSRFRHHDNLNALKISATDGCHLCVLLMGSLSRNDLELLRWSSVPISDRQLQQYKILFQVRNFYGGMLLTLHFHYPSCQGASIWRSLKMIKLQLQPAWPVPSLESESNTTILSKPGDSTGSASAFVCVQRWLETCTQTHRLCSRIRSATSWKPTRLLALGTVAVMLPPRLVERDEIQAGVVYATLSHCCKYMSS